jgi:hypothetical protein
MSVLTLIIIALVILAIPTLWRIFCFCVDIWEAALEAGRKYEEEHYRKVSAQRPHAQPVSVPQPRPAPKKRPKLALVPEPQPPQPEPVPDDMMLEEAVSALRNFGIRKADAEKKVKKVAGKSGPDLTLEMLITEALSA